ncbi:hypothetical protein ASD15_14565 [Massilia sp. Root351]|jgi:hypothetical protein|nr:hypothetical protein ASD15_14565 [Massilia sp. Root351]
MALRAHRCAGPDGQAPAHQVVRAARRAFAGVIQKTHVLPLHAQSQRAGQVAFAAAHVLKHYSLHQRIAVRLHAQFVLDGRGQDRQRQGQRQC